MNLILNLEIMRDSFKIAHPMLIHQQEQNDEAIETVRAMQEALRLAVEHFDTIYPTARGDDFLVDACVEALRRAEGNAG